MKIKLPIPSLLCAAALILGAPASAPAKEKKPPPPLRNSAIPFTARAWQSDASQPCRNPEILNETGVFARARFFIRLAQKRGGVDRRHDAPSQLGLE